MDKLSLVRDFWDETPCDGHSSYEMRSQFRYRKDAWLLPLLDRIAASFQRVLEVGCGQGTDGLTLCQKLQPGQHYVGVDMSARSIGRAHAAAAEVCDRLHVTPLFELGNAEELSFSDNSFDCVFSVGVLHHTVTIERAIGELWRVLVPGGKAFVGLYRTAAPKVFAAHLLRGMQRCLDAGLRTDRIVYRTLRSMNLGESRGTAIYECFGVPILRSYTHRDMYSLFRDFSSFRLSSHGFDFFALSGDGTLTSNPLGYLWLAEAIK